MPPDGVAVASPSQARLQDVLLPAVVAVKRGGSIIITVSVAVQLLASVTVTIYVPGHKPVAFGVVCTGVVFHE